MRYALDETAAPERLLPTVLAQRAARRGARVERTAEGYVVDAATARAAEVLGLPVTAAGDRAGTALGVPRVAVFCGAAIGYPYYAYYAHCLTSLGLAWHPVGAEAVAAGELAGFDLLVMPGGFATWGLDRAEEVSGVDAAVRAHLARGGAFIGSCGGAYYLSQGRPHWLGLIDAKPKYTHEYLQTGAGLVNVRIDPDLGRHLPATLELAYYHGPAYPAEDGGRRARTLATFVDLALPSRLFIDNPLARECFEHDLAGRPAALCAADARAVVFSPHPEMGDFLRKGIALDGYVRRYLPIRGRKTMAETLRFYAREDCLSFRLVLNAMAHLGLLDAGATQAPAPLPPVPLEDDLRGLDAVLPQAAAAVRARARREEDAGLADLLAAELDRLDREWEAVAEGWRCGPGRAEEADGDVQAGLSHALRDAAGALAHVGEGSCVETIVLIALPIRLAAAALRLVRCDQALAEAEGVDRP